MTFLHISLTINIEYKSTVVDFGLVERPWSTERRGISPPFSCSTMTSKVSKALADVLRSNEDFWNSFDQVIIYYDNGQIELTKILTSVFSTLYTHVEFRKVKPVDYKLFQIADLICTMELLSEKAETNSFSRSEMEFFDKIRDFKKNYLKHLKKKSL